ncbi:MAG: nucleotidyltransferase substrate binding protein [Acidobacteria bacterium]|nr:nucleotidyltransferase substrate binding protein [Acidobacteriota bacterium]
MEQLKERLATCKRALGTLEEVLAMPFTVVVRDASIQRFEYSFESLWKLLKEFLYRQQGISCYSPKQCIREALKTNLLSPEQAEAFLIMVDDRNLVSHTYIEAIAEAIYKKLPAHLGLMKELFGKIQSEMKGHGEPG